MADEKKSSNFGLGVLFGTIIGGIAAFFLSPASGAENREMVAKKVKKLRKWLDEADIPGTLKEIYGEATDEGTKLYKEVKKELESRLADVKEMVDEFDFDKYKDMVEEVVDKVKTEADETTERAEKLKEFLIDKWEKMKDMGEKDVEKVVTKTKKKTSKK